MKTSQDGIAFIKHYEGFSPSQYQDVAGYWSIGYGHRMQCGEIFDVVSEEQAGVLLIHDLSIAERAVGRLVKIPLTQNQFDALVSLAYNIGSQAFEKSTLLRNLNAGEIRDAAAQFGRWVYANGRKQPGLEARRRAETVLFSQDISRKSMFMEL